MINYYQTIPELNIKGRMNTPEEFDKIGLPKDLEGKRVLDIGCNIGAFLFECYRRNASLLVGVEINAVWRWLATGILRENVIPNSMWDIYSSIDEILFGEYDLVLCLSVTHVSEGKSGQEVLDQAWGKVKKDGLLILEINDRLQEEKLKLPEGGKLYGQNKDNRSVYHFIKL